MRILHISDMHNQAETMERLDILAHERKDVEVVACTGDVQCQPNSWSKWPQRVKLLVPGDHDSNYSFESLHGWNVQPPWVHRDWYLGFFGYDCRHGWQDFTCQLRRYASGISDVKALVLLAHCWPTGESAKAVSSALKAFLPGVAIAFLHGHNHPKDHESPEWEAKADLGGLTCARSKIISSARDMRGVAGLITWDHKKFTMEVLKP